MIGVLLVSGIPVANALNEMPLYENRSISVSNGSYIEYRFIPAVRGYYTISSTGSADSFVTFLDGAKNLLSTNDNGGSGNNFSLRCYMAANATYYFRFSSKGSGSGTYAVRLEMDEFEGPSGTVKAYVDSNYTPRSYKFYPKESGVYRFYTGLSNVDTKIYIYNSAGEELEYDDDDGPDRNFSLTRYFKAGEVYSIKPGYYSTTSSGKYDVYFSKLVPDSLDVKTSSAYYINDKTDAGIISVTAKYNAQTDCIDSFEYSPQRNEYTAQIDTSTPGEKALTVSYSGAVVTLSGIKVKTPSVYIKDKNGIEYHNEYDTCFINSLSTRFTAVTDPNVVTVKWVSQNPEAIKINVIDEKIAEFNVINPNDAVVTAKYTYNGINYSQSFNLNFGLIVKDVKITENKTSYAYGSSFKREKVKVTYQDVVSKELLAQTISMYGDLPSTKAKIGSYKRTIKFGDVSTSYTYKVVCSKPEIKSVKSKSSSKQVVEWSKSNGAKGYYVYRATSKDGKYTKIGSTTSTTFTSTGLKALTNYYYKVRAYYKTGDSTYDSSSSSPVGAKTKLATPKISSVTPKSSSKQTITWDKVSGAKGYYVYYSTSKDGSYTKIATTSKTSYTKTGLKANKVYYYKVKAYYDTAKSTYDSSYSSVASGRTKLSTPSGVKATAGKKKITVSWNSVSGAKSYNVYRATSKNGEYTKITTVKSTKYTNSGLSSKKTYYYKIRAVSKTKGCDSASSPVVSAKTK